MFWSPVFAMERPGPSRGRLCHPGASVTLSRGTGGEGGGILANGSPQGLPSGTLEFPEIAATKGALVGMTVARALKHWPPCMIFKQVTSGIH